MAGQGLKPYFLKKCKCIYIYLKCNCACYLTDIGLCNYPLLADKKKLELADKYNELKRSGKLENFLSKKRKRNAGKDRRKLPFQHKDQ